MQESPGQRQDVIHATLVFERQIPAAVADVFDAYADARVRAIWSVSSNDSIIYDQAEFFEGGRDQFRCGPESNPNVQGMTYYWEILANQRIVCSELLTMEGMKLAVAVITTEFAEQGNTTGLKCTVQVASFVGPDMVQGYEDGHNGALDGLVRYFRQVDL